MEVKQKIIRFLKTPWCRYSDVTEEGEFTSEIGSGRARLVLIMYLQGSYRRHYYLFYINVFRNTLL